jgi:hypothetical protein
VLSAESILFDTWPSLQQAPVALMAPIFSSINEARRIFELLCEQADQLGLPPNLREIKEHVTFRSDYDRIYFPIPFKETETAAALKAVEGSVAIELANLKYGTENREVIIDLERATCFLFQAYLARIDGLGKLDDQVKTKLKGSITSLKTILF